MGGLANPTLKVPYHIGYSVTPIMGFQTESRGKSDEKHARSGLMGLI